MVKCSFCRGDFTPVNNPPSVLAGVCPRCAIEKGLVKAVDEGVPRPVDEVVVEPPKTETFTDLGIEPPNAYTGVPEQGGRKTKRGGEKGA